MPDELSCWYNTTACGKITSRIIQRPDPDGAIDILAIEYCGGRYNFGTTGLYGFVQLVCIIYKNSQPSTPIALAVFTKEDFYAIF